MKNEKFIKIIRLLFLMTTLGVFLNAESILKDLTKHYISKEEKTSQNIIFPYYANESGLMLGHFYYNTNFLNHNATITNVLLYTPKNNIGVDYFTLKDYPIFKSKNWKFESELFLAKFSEIRIYSFGNNSIDDEIDYNKIFQQEPLLGYDYGQGEQSKTKFSFVRAINDINKIKLTYFYDSTNNEMELAKKFSSEKNIQFPSKLNYKTDKLGIEWSRNTSINSIKPNSGSNVILGIEKSLNFLSHDDDNDWDYYRLKLDYRKHLRINDRSNLSLRFYTINLEYLREPEKNVKNLDVPTLGDLNNFRGFYYSRFRGKNLALYQGEYRFSLNKADNLRMGIFGEVGRVKNDDYNLELFYKNLKWDFGLGLKYFFNKNVMLRADLARSKESTQIRFATSQAF